MFVLLLSISIAGCAPEQEAQQEPTNTDEQSETQQDTQTTSENVPTPSEAGTTQDFTPPPAETTQARVGETTSENIPTVAVGERVSLGPFDFRLLDYVSIDRYSYVENTYPSIGEVDMVDAYPQAGKFVVVTYALENTSNSPVDPEGGATLSTAEPEFYDVAEQVNHPPTFYGDRTLQPRQMRVGQFIFDVPQDVEPSQLNVFAADEFGQLIEPGVNVNLTEEASQETPPEQILALQYEYINMAAFDEAYALFADQSQQIVSPEQYKAYFESVGPYGIKDYSFPSVQVQGDTATVEIVYTGFSMVTEEEQLQRTQQMVLEEDGWRVVMRDEQIAVFTGS